MSRKKIHSAFDLGDGSLGSRKFLLAIFSIILLTAVSLVGVEYPAVVGILPTFVGGLLGVVSLYYGGNIANKFITGKNLSALPVEEEDTEKDPEPVAPAAVPKKK